MRGSIKATATVDSRTGATSVVTTVVGSNPNVTENASNIDSDVDELTATAKEQDLMPVLPLRSHISHKY